MTSRLKHKLELENVNLRSAYLNESFVQIGTPLPALADVKKDTQEFKPVWEQEVRDEQGRRRFHGAFQGGWSAGYYNTVGSKEGWQPSEFKSSRTNRASRTQRPEDFMDDEDLASLRADRELEHTDAFRSAAGPSRPADGASLPAALESFVVPAQTSIGTSLLQKLGWRPGQGIGPRVSLRKLRRQDARLGRAADDDEGGEGGEGGEAGKHTFAPRDTWLVVFAGKEDKEGLGYVKGRGMGKLPGKRPVLGMDDDDDPYVVDSGPPTYVFDGMDDAEDVVVMGEPSAPSRTGAAKGTDTWHDGRPVLAGFTLDPLGVPADKWFAFPDVPDDWRPRPARVWGTTRRFDDEPAEEAQAVVRGAPNKPLTHDQRGAALGEEEKTSAAKSVFEFITEKDRERLAAFAAAAKDKDAPRPQLSMDEAPELPPERATEVVIPPLSPRTASAALKGYAPYADDPDRQDRYQSYLVSQTLNTKHPNPTLLPSLNVDEVNKELEAFAASARIFKPMSFAMSSRFTTGSAALASSDMKQAKPGLHLFDAEKAALAIEESKKHAADAAIEAKALGPREQAAANGMYGALTREVKDFYPVKLVCKRFHVADPHPDAKGGEGEGDKGADSGGGYEAAPLPANDASWATKFVHQEGTERDPTPPPEPAGAGERAPRSLADVGMGDDGNQGRDTLTYTKPSIDIFKAIFASDDEDEDEDGGAGGGGDYGGDVEPAVAAAADSAPADPFPVEATPVDYATFKPVFKRTDGERADRKRDKKDKKKRKGLLSFDVGEDEADAAPRDKKRPREKETRDAGEPRTSTADAADPATGEWVEKVAGPSGMVPARPEAVADTVAGGVVEPRTGRKGAADYM